MSETSDRLEEIRERKRQELQSQAGGQGATEDQGPATAPNEPIYVRDQAHFQEITNSYDVVLADFYADWCGPCKMLEPIVEDLAAETDAAIAKVDVDAHQQLAGQYQVRGVPTVVLFADGEVAEQVVGVRDKNHYRSLIDRLSN